MGAILKFSNVAFLAVFVKKTQASMRAAKRVI